MKDLHNNLSPTSAFNTRTINTNATTNGTIIDRQGFEALQFVLYSGTLTDGSYTPVLEHGDAANLSDAASVPAADLLGTIAGATIAVTDDNAVKRVGYIGSKRYVRLSVTSATVTTGGMLGALALRGYPTLLPTS